MDLPFALRGIAGHVQVDMDITRDPAGLGAMLEAAGLPHCRAVVRYPAQGYAAMLGWIQLVRSTDNGRRGERFEMDPLALVGEVAHPFAFFGVTPTLFDAPARAERAGLDWLAHSFLCYLADDDPAGRTISMITGFSWGFTLAAGVMTPVFPHLLTATAWNEHRALLRADHPAWHFTEHSDGG